MCRSCCIYYSIHLYKSLPRASQKIICTLQQQVVLKNKGPTVVKKRKKQPVTEKAPVGSLSQPHPSSAPVALAAPRRSEVRDTPPTYNRSVGLFVLQDVRIHGVSPPLVDVSVMSEVPARSELLYILPSIACLYEYSQCCIFKCYLLLIWLLLQSKYQSIHEYLLFA